MLGSTISLLIFIILLKQQQHAFKERERASQLEVTNALGKSFTSEIDLKKLLQLICLKGQTALRASASSLRFFGEQKDEFVYCGLKTEDFPHFIESDIVSYSGKKIGHLEFHNANPFPESSQNLLESIASLAAVAIENDLLFEKANNAIKIRDEFLNVASHELKTPITSLKLQFQMALKMIRDGNDKVYDREAVQRRVKKAVQQFDRMNALIEDMLDSSSVSMSRMILNLDPMELNAHIEDIIEGFIEQFNTLKIPYNLYRRLNQQ
jgi:signal transduction histidine kinase